MTPTLLMLTAPPVRHTLWSGPAVQALRQINTAHSTVAWHARITIIFIYSLRSAGLPPAHPLFEFFMVRMPLSYYKLHAKYHVIVFHIYYNHTHPLYAYFLGSSGRYAIKKHAHIATHAALGIEPRCTAGAKAPRQ